VQNQREDDQQEGVEDAEEFAIERAAKPGDGVYGGGGGFASVDRRRGDRPKAPDVIGSRGSRSTRTQVASLGPGSATT
jgi:hypothetical protein